MRLLVHDFAGYPYPAQLSRALAARGHTVRHVYCASIPTTPGGDLQPGPDDPPTLAIEPIHLAEPLAKFSFVKRWRQETAYGHLAAAAVRRFRPDVVISSNTPLDAHRALMRACRDVDARFVFWVQDLLGVAAHRILRRKLPVVGDLIGRYYVWLEQTQLRHSAAVVMLTDDFRPLLRRWQVPEPKLFTIENWAPLEALPVRPKANAWAQAHGLAETQNLIYAGTLAMKHNPDLLLRAALRLRDRPDVRVVVLSQGPGADWLRQQKAAHGLGGLLIQDFEPFERMPEVMGAADVLLAVLERDAGVFSVPSKVLAYLCAERPVLLAVPPENLIARIVGGHEAGLVVPPDAPDAFADAAERLLRDADLRARLGRNARRYAETTFDIDRIAGDFERVLAAAQAS